MSQEPDTYDEYMWLSNVIIVKKQIFRKSGMPLIIIWNQWITQSSGKSQQLVISLHYCSCNSLGASFLVPFPNRQKKTLLVLFGEPLL